MTDIWSNVLGIQPGILPGQVPWEDAERVRKHLVGTHQPQVWLGRIGIAGASMKWYVDGAEAFVRQAATAVTPKPGRPPLLAINHVGSGRGGAGYTKGDLLTALFRRLVELVQEVDVDVVVVSYDARAHAAAQRARMHALVGKGPDSLTEATRQWTFETEERTHALHERATELADHIRGLRLALFMGAGVSVGAGLPGWRDLIVELGTSRRMAIRPSE